MSTIRGEGIDGILRLMVNIYYYMNLCLQSFVQELKTREEGKYLQKKSTV
jgi:hypothetical protein